MNQKHEKIFWNLTQKMRKDSNSFKIYEYVFRDVTIDIKTDWFLQLRGGGSRIAFHTHDTCLYKNQITALIC